jgi:hypothetical protein
MPIPVQKLKEARRPMVDRVREFLARDPSHAFSTMEVLAGVQGDDRETALLKIALLEPADFKASVGPIEGALAELLQKGAVEAAEYEGLTYYCFVEKHS